MEDEGSSRTITRGQKVPAYKRRVWSLAEEQVLLNLLREIVVTGMKCENGFRTGYLKILEKAMKKAFPDTDLRAQPHIDSKIHVWRKHHSSLTTMLSRSGFGWDTENKKITVENKQIWDEYVKTDGHAKGMWNKSYPMYDAWQEVFGKERATGENAEDLEAADNNPLKSPEPLANADDQPIADESPTAGDSDFMSVCGPSENAPFASRTVGKKRKSNGPAEIEIVELMGKFCDQVDKRLGDIASQMGYEMKMSEKKAGLFEAIGRLGVLNSGEQIYIHKLLSNNNKDMEAFYNLPEEARGQMVRMICDGQL